MNRIAKFEKVSWEQFLYDYLNCNSLEENFDNCRSAKQVYENIKLPERATSGSAGYDFFAPVSGCLEPPNIGLDHDSEFLRGTTIKIPSGIRCVMEPNWVLVICPRSSLGMKHRLQLDGTLGIIDSDYAFAENEGHIFLQLTNDSRNGTYCQWECGDRIAQGIFLPYGITEDDNATGRRTGGIGSTGR